MVDLSLIDEFYKAVGFDREYVSSSLLSSASGEEHRLDVRIGPAVSLHLPINGR